MQPVQPVQPRVSAFRIGLLFGVVLAIILIALDFGSLAAQGAGILFSIVSIIVALVAYFFAGFRASARSGRVRDGLLAGMWTGIISEILSSIVSILLSLSRLPELTRLENQQFINNGLSTRVTDSTVLIFIIVGTIVGIIIISAIALGIGAIGGAVGKGRAPLPQQAYQESLYQSPMGGPPPLPGYPPQPQGGYPGYPPQQPGGYPPQPGQYPPESGGYPPQR